MNREANDLLNCQRAPSDSSGSSSGDVGHDNKALFSDNIRAMMDPAHTPMSDSDSVDAPASGPLKLKEYVRRITVLTRRGTMTLI